MNMEGSGLSKRSSAPSGRGIRLTLEALLLLFFLLGLFTWSLYREMRSLTLQSQSFNCTVYYTPIEAAFTKNHGFNLQPETRPGLDGISYPADFLKAVALEGFGRLKNPAGEKKYIYYNGHWGYAAAPMGNHSNSLQGKMSCAITSRNGKFASNDWIFLRSKNLPLKIEARPWRVDDVGAGVGASQIDLYWGEDAPAGPDEDLQRPAGIQLSRVTHVGIYPIPGKARLLRFWIALQESPFSGLAMHLLNPLMDSALQTADISPTVGRQALAADGYLMTASPSP